VEGITVGGKGVTARKDDVIHIPVLLKRFFRAKDPLVAAF
jgi:hypothetical protein